MSQYYDSDAIVDCRVLRALFNLEVDDFIGEPFSKAVDRGNEITSGLELWVYQFFQGYVREIEGE